VKGVINLRGKVTPVVDLRLKFGLQEAEYTQRTCIIVVQVTGGAGPMLMGIIVDSVSEVLNLTSGDIEDTPDFGRRLHHSFLLGMAKTKGKVQDPARNRSGAGQPGAGRAALDVGTVKGLRKRTR